MDLSTWYVSLNRYIFFISINFDKLILCWVVLMYLYSNISSSIATTSSSYLLLSVPPCFRSNIKRNQSHKLFRFFRRKVITPDASKRLLLSKFFVLKLSLRPSMPKTCWLKFIEVIKPLIIPACGEFGSFNFYSSIIFTRSRFNVKTLPLSLKIKLLPCFVLFPIHTRIIPFTVRIIIKTKMVLVFSFHKIS